MDRHTAFYYISCSSANCFVFCFCVNLLSQCSLRKIADRPFAIGRMAGKNTIKRKVACSHRTETSITSASASALESHVRKLAEEIGPRHILRPDALAAARDYIRDQWRAEGYVVETQEYTVRDILCMNVIVTLPGIALPDQVLLAGAHYDTVPRSPGADDNASGVAGLLELGRRLSACRPRRTIRLVAFVNEEPPFFYWSRDGQRKVCSRGQAAWRGYPRHVLA